MLNPNTIAARFLISATDIPQGLRNIIQTVSNKIKKAFHFDMPKDVEWRTFNHPDYEEDKKQNSGKDDGGFITRDFKKIYIDLDRFKNESYENIVTHEMGHFLDRQLGGGSYFSHTIGKNISREVFAMMVEYVINEKHSGGGNQTLLYNAACDKIGIPQEDRVHPGTKKSLCANYLKIIAQVLKTGRYIKEKGPGAPGRLPPKRGD